MPAQPDAEVQVGYIRRSGVFVRPEVQRQGHGGLTEVLPFMNQAVQFDPGQNRVRDLRYRIYSASTVGPCLSSRPAETARPMRSRMAVDFMMASHPPWKNRRTSLAIRSPSRVSTPLIHLLSTVDEGKGRRCKEPNRLGCRQSVIWCCNMREGSQVLSKSPRSVQTCALSGRRGRAVTTARDHLWAVRRPDFSGSGQLPPGEPAARETETSPPSRPTSPLEQLQRRPRPLRGSS